MSLLLRIDVDHLDGVNKAVTGSQDKAASAPAEVAKVRIINEYVA